MDGGGDEESVNNFCKTFLFPRTKFIKNDGWKDYLTNKKNCIYLLCM